MNSLDRPGAAAWGPRTGSKKGPAGPRPPLDPLAPETGDRERQSPQSLRERKIATLSSEPWASVCDLQCDDDIPVGKKGLLQNGENAKTETPPTRGPSPGWHGSSSGISGLALGLRGSPASEHAGSPGRLTPPLSRSGPIGGVRSRPAPPVLEPCLRGSWPGTWEPKRSDSATDLPAFLPRQVRAYVVFWGGGSRGLPLRLTESSLPEFAPAWRRRSLCLGTSVFRPRTLWNHSQFLLPFSGRWKRRLSQTAVSLWKTQEPFFKCAGVVGRPNPSPRVPERLVPAPNHSQHNPVPEAGASAKVFSQPRA